MLCDWHCCSIAAQLNTIMEDIVKERTGRLQLHAWMHHQIVAAFLDAKQPQSYAAFLRSQVHSSALDDVTRSCHTQLFFESLDA